MLRNKQIFDIADKCDEGQEGNEFLVAFAYAIESAATAPLLARIAELELEVKALTQDREVLALEGNKLTRELEEARNDAAAEREECAKVAKAISDKYAFGHYGNEVDTADEIAAAIRARGTK